MFGLIEILIYLWLCGALIDMAVRARDEFASWSQETPFSLVWKALVWPGKRPWDVLKAIWNGVRRAGKGM